MVTVVYVWFIAGEDSFFRFVPFGFCKLLESIESRHKAPVRRRVEGLTHLCHFRHHQYLPVPEEAIFFSRCHQQSAMPSATSNCS